jgi:nitrite reductase (NADH) small subunit
MSAGATRPAPALATQTWGYNLGPVSRIPPGEGKTFIVAARLVAVFRTRTGQLFATQASCPRGDGRLADGLVGGTHLVCPLHGFRFDLTSGMPIGNNCSAIKTYPVEASSRGDIRLYLEDR